MRQIDCDTYWIIFNDWTQLNELCKDTYPLIMVLVDENTEADCLPLFRESFTHRIELIKISSGEQNKSLDTCNQIWNRLLDLGADRHSLLINLGGGVIGDMGGFCAATFMRGIDFIQVPTTLLSMVDSSIGGKLGIDLGTSKNMVGLFQNPQAVFIFPQFLRTLPTRELNSGMAEVYKHGLIRDADYFEDAGKVDVADSETIWEELITRSVEIKKDVVTEDPLEGGLRKILNYGHTIGHAIESLNLDTDTHLLHGEAIALGMITEAYVSSERTGLAQGELEVITQKMLSAYTFPSKVNLDLDEIMKYCSKDKKNKGGLIRASLLKSIGECEVDVELSREDVAGSLEYLRACLRA